MKTILSIALLCSAAHAQVLAGIISANENASQAAAPSFSPPAGAVPNPTSVTLSTVTSGATICYTTNGSDPAASTPGTCSAGSTYSTPISVTVGVTIKALATKSGIANSNISSATYTIDSETTFVTGQTLGSTRHDYPGCVGMKIFNDNSATKTITQLGRWIVAGNSQSHVLALEDASGNAVASCTLNTSGQTAGAYAFCSITPYTTSLSTTYYVVSHENNGGDDWYDTMNITTQTTSIATLSDAYGTTSGANCSGVTPNINGTKSFVPVNFKYH